MVSKSFMYFSQCGTWTHIQCWRWGHTAKSKADNLFLLSVGSAGPDAPQGTLGPSGCQGSLLAHVQLAFSQKPQIPFCRTALQPLVLRSVHLRALGVFWKCSQLLYSNLGVRAVAQGKEVLDLYPLWVWWDFRPSSPTLQEGTSVCEYTYVPANYVGTMPLYRREH